ncbi:MULTISPECIES: hypothetical protein [Halobacterium]|uniref:DUF7322 domain-containing protein n=1 Tax=Halobacterium TaxID=2239 RepID=UPI00073F7BD9|nr:MULTISPECIES: hypothetical protein [Halobacterium]MCG1002561.1 hypothetical protein [Halobacterium noricense]
MFDESEADGDHDFLDDEPSDAEQELAPKVETPSVSAPEIPDGSDAPAGLRRRFWTLVVTFNVALIAVSLGLMFVAFRGRLQYGGAAVVLGLVLFAFGYRRFRQYTAEDGDDAEDADDADAEDATDE